MGRYSRGPASYRDANELLGTRASRKLANNTYLIREWDDIYVRLHSTAIVTFYRDGRIRINTGGWNTVTTRERVNRYIGADWSTGTDRGELYLYHRAEDTWMRYAFDRTAILRPNGTTDATPKPKRKRTTRRPHTNPECACVACAGRRRSGAWRTRWQESTPAGVVSHVSDTTTPEDTAAEANVPDAIGEVKWSEYNRKFNELFRSKA